jgi:NAD(P)H-nitrite reductase large subunit
MALICHCHAVNDCSIASAVHDGARSLCEVQQRCQAGTRCGGCVGAIEELLEHHAPSVFAGAGSMLAAHAG